MSDKSNFEKLKTINVNDKTEKKGRFTYLSWAWAVDVLLTHDPSATWGYGEPITLPDGTMLVFCTVTAFGKPMSMQLPVINMNNKPIANPNAFDVNTAMQRCLVKAIALHGLGLYIYAGEDLPQSEDGEVYAVNSEEDKAKSPSTRLPKLTEAEAEKAYLDWTAAKEKLHAESEGGVADPEVITNAWGKLPSNVRRAVKDYGESIALIEQNDSATKQHIASIN